MEKITKRILSGVQPSGDLHLGNYLGAIKNFVSLQKEFECFFCVVDLHAITVWQDPKILKQKTREVAAAFIASGIDPDKNTREVAAAYIASGIDPKKNIILFNQM